MAVAKLSDFTVEKEFKAIRNRENMMLFFRFYVCIYIKHETWSCKVIVVIDPYVW